tara:strand:- start:55 stop:246 length:192 start_codon:yes stop_codon:yes gene_type:complete
MYESTINSRDTLVFEDGTMQIFMPLAPTGSVSVQRPLNPFRVIYDAELIIDIPPAYMIDGGRA